VVILVDAPSGAILERNGVFMSAILEGLKGLRDRFTRREAEKVVERESTWAEMVQRLANGENVPFEQIEGVVDSARMSSAITCPSGCNSSIIKTKKLNGKIDCQCRSCGREFVPETCNDSVGEWSIERLTRDVELEIKARENRAQIKKLPELLAEKERLAKLDNDEVEALRAARVRCDKVREELQRPILLNASEIEAAEKALAELRASYAQRHPAASAKLKLLQKSRGQKALKAQELRQELFGHGATTGAVEPFDETLGWKWLVYLRKHMGYSGGAVNLKKVDPTKNQSIYIPKRNDEDANKYTFEEFTQLWTTKIQPMIAEAERCETEAAKLDTEIAELEAKAIQL